MSKIRPKRTGGRGRRLRPPASSRRSAAAAEGPRLLAVVGRSGTGKTTTIEFLISEFSAMGLEVGAVKRIHDPSFTIDTPGKDTHRLSAAGARVVVSSADGEVATIVKMPSHSRDYFLPEIVEQMRRLGVDVVLLEGFHSVVARMTGVPKVVTARVGSDLDEMLGLAGEPVVAVTGVIGEGEERATSSRRPPVLSLGRDGRRLFSIVTSALGLRRRPGRLPERLDQP